MKKIAFLILLSIILVTAGCNKATSTSNEGEKNTIHVTTTIFPLEDFTKKIGGEYVTVESIYPAGADAHTYEPTPKTMIDIAESDLFIYSGTGLEAFAEDAAKSLSSEDVHILAAADGMDLLSSNEHHDEEHADHEEEEHADHEHEGHEEEEHTDHDGEGHSEDGHDGHEHDHGDMDPHVWIDPILSIQLAENIKNELVHLMPENTSYFEENFNQLKADLESLDEEFKSMVSESNNKKIIVSHAAYGYWESRYGIEQIGVSGISPNQEPSQKQLEVIIETAKEENIQYIIFEQNISTKLSNIIQNEIGAEALYLHNISVLTDADIQNGEDYFSLMKKNIQTLATALQ